MKKAKWVWLPGGGRADEYAVFADEFTAKGNVSADISVAGDYALYVNGRLAAFGQYADYEDYKVFDRIDLTGFVRPGRNEMRIVAWYVGEDFSTCRKMPAGLIYEVAADGRPVAWSGADTKCAPAEGYVSGRKKTITVQLGYSYTYDFRTVQGKEMWQNAALCAGFGALYPRPNRKLRLGGLTEGRLIDREKRIYDLGRECSGFLTFRLRAEPGAHIVVGFGEHIEDGAVREQIDGRDFTVEFYADGAADEFTGTFRRLGCRYLQVTCDSDIEIEQIGVREPAYPLVKKPYRADSSLHQKIYDVAVRTLELCVHEHYEDCPWREQSMYIMDSRNQMLCGYYAFDNPECARSAIRLFLHGQKENGLFELCFPARVPITIPSFALTLPSVVLEYSQYARSSDAAEESFGALEKMLAYFLPKLDGRGLFKTVTEEGIWHFYEWAGDLDGAFFSPDGSEKLRNEFDSLINAFISVACGAMREIAVLLCRFDRAAYYEEMRQRINAGILKVFFSEEKGVFLTREGKEDCNALANALCILCGACPAERAGAIAEKLIGGWEGWIPNSLSMDKFRYDALLAVDEEKYAPLIVADIDKTYSYMLDKGATSFWETIRGQEDFALAGSLCHGWSALPVYYYRILTGNREKKLSDAFRLKDHPSRSEYRDCVLDYIQKRSEKSCACRDKYLYMPEQKKRKALRSMLGAPLNAARKERPVGFSSEVLWQTEEMTAERCRLEVEPGFYFSGILYRRREQEEKNALIFALHGGGGTPERIGDLFIDSANYNHMVKRILLPGTMVFAPQLLLWNEEIFGSGYDRWEIAKRLIQLGGSITALELFCLQRSLDYFETLEEVDRARIGVIGLSYGGMYALHAGALDVRFSATYSSCWFSDRRRHNWNDWIYFGQERKMFDAEVASLVFPRRLFIEVADRDEAFPAADAEQELQRLEGYAGICGYQSRFRAKRFGGTHELDTDSGMLNEFLNYLRRK